MLFHSAGLHLGDRPAQNLHPHGPPWLSYYNIRNPCSLVTHCSDCFQQAFTLTDKPIFSRVHMLWENIENDLEGDVSIMLPRGGPSGWRILKTVRAQQFIILNQSWQVIVDLNVHLHVC